MFARASARLADGPEASVAMVSVGSSRGSDSPWGRQDRLGEQVSASRAKRSGDVEDLPHSIRSLTLSLQVALAEFASHELLGTFTHDLHQIEPTQRRISPRATDPQGDTEQVVPAEVLESVDDGLDALSHTGGDVLDRAMLGGLDLQVHANPALVVQQGRDDEVAHLAYAPLAQRELQLEGGLVGGVWRREDLEIYPLFDVFLLTSGEFMRDPHLLQFRAEGLLESKPGLKPRSSSHEYSPLVLITISSIGVCFTPRKFQSKNRAFALFCLLGWLS